MIKISKPNNNTFIIIHKNIFSNQTVHYRDVDPLLRDKEMVFETTTAFIYDGFITATKSHLPYWQNLREEVFNLTETKYPSYRTILNRGYLWYHIFNVAQIYILSNTSFNVYKCIVVLKQWTLQMCISCISGEWWGQHEYLPEYMRSEVWWCSPCPVLDWAFCEYRMNNAESLHTCTL